MITRHEIERLASDLSEAIKRADSAEENRDIVKAFAILWGAAHSAMVQLESMARYDWEADRRRFLNAEGEDVHG